MALPYFNYTTASMRQIFWTFFVVIFVDIANNYYAYDKELAFYYGYSVWKWK